LGSTLSSQFYGESIARATALRDGWASQQNAIDVQMAGTAASIIAKLSPLKDSMRSLGYDSAQALLDGLKTQDSVLLAHAQTIGAQMAQAIADALVAANIASGGNNFGSAATSANAESARLVELAAANAAAAAKKQWELDHPYGVIGTAPVGTSPGAGYTWNGLRWVAPDPVTAVTSAMASYTPKTADSQSSNDLNETLKKILAATNTGNAENLATQAEIQASIAAQAKQIQTLSRAGGLGGSTARGD
jgi:hypothetical protein